MNTAKTEGELQFQEPSFWRSQNLCIGGCSFSFGDPRSEKAAAKTTATAETIRRSWLRQNDGIEGVADGL
jgi:hypothetical protein